MPNMEVGLDFVCTTAVLAKIGSEGTEKAQYSCAPVKTHLECSHYGQPACVKTVHVSRGCTVSNRRRVLKCSKTAMLLNFM